MFAWPERMRGRFEHRVTRVVILAGAALSVWLVRAITRARDEDPWPMASTALDALLGFAIVAPSVLCLFDAGRV